MLMRSLKQARMTNVDGLINKMMAMSTIISNILIIIIFVIAATAI